MTETILLGSVAIRCFGQQLTWDAAAMRFPNTRRPSVICERRYREGEVARS